MVDSVVESRGIEVSGQAELPAAEGLAEHWTPTQLLQALHQERDLSEVFAPTAAGQSALEDVVADFQGSDDSDRFYFPGDTSATELKIRDFDLSPVSQGGDQLDLRDLLVDENPDTLDRYLEFSALGDETGAVHTQIAVSRHGDGGVDHRITLEQLDPGSDPGALLQSFVDNGSLLVDQ